MTIRLSTAQQKAVNHTDGALLVVAGPGSGKTRVLTERIRRLISEVDGHFQILALTFTNKAANEMTERLQEIPNISERAFIGTLHSFCMEVLARRGKAVGINGLPQIFSAFQDRRATLARAVHDDPELSSHLKLAGEHKEQGKRLDAWLRMIIKFKSKLYRSHHIAVDIERKVFDSYQAELRSSGAVDFDDLLLLTYQLFEERPKIANFYRRLYRFICIDEAQDLNGAQYGVLQALCGDQFKNVMMVGDKKQAIYGFNTADPKFMDDFKRDFDAKLIQLHDNFRSSRSVVEFAKKIDHTYYADVENLPVEGAVKLITGKDEENEAELIIRKITRLRKNGHPDVETPITLESCAILGRTRYTLLKIEEKLREHNLRYYKQLKADHESESSTAKAFELCLRLLVNPKDRLHFDELKKMWNVQENFSNTNKEKANTGIERIMMLTSRSKAPEATFIQEAVSRLNSSSASIQMKAALDILENYGNGLTENDKRAVLEDVKVLRGEWSRFLRFKRAGENDLGSFLTHMALGTMQQPRQDGVALLTVHSSKGLEFDVVFILGMSDGTFPDYRARQKTAPLAEERRNFFVSVTRSKRLLYLSYPQQKEMPWGDIWDTKLSPFLSEIRDRNPMLWNRLIT
ncbi:MAG: ATP-dependent helicase [bacterium]|nr:ATP-dependent helicase [bacterium]